MPATAPRPSAAVVPERPCGAAVFRTALPVDTVSVRFQRAFTSVGFTRATSAQQGDTARVAAGPTRLAGAWAGGTYAVRLVALRRGDSTYFRHFLRVAPPPDGWPAPYDSVTPTGARYTLTPANSWIGLCGVVSQRAQVHGWAPRDPNGQEALALWMPLGATAR